MSMEYNHHLRYLLIDASIEFNSKNENLNTKVWMDWTDVCNPITPDRLNGSGRKAHR